MKNRRAIPLMTAAVLAPMALAAAPSAPATTTVETAQASDFSTVERVEDLPIAFLEANLPRNAAEAGLDYAPRMVKVHTIDQADRSAVADMGLDVTEHAGHDYVEVVLGSAAQEQQLIDAGRTYTVETPDMITRERERILADAAFSQATAISDMPSGRTTYRTLADYGTEIDALVAANPTIAKRISIGESAEGRELTGIEIGVGVNDPEDGRPVFLMFGNHHAREWPPAETPMEFAHDLIQTFNDGDPRSVDLVSRTRTIIVPVSNPDGYTYSRTSGDLIDLNEFGEFDPLDGTGVILVTPGQAYKRKNCVINPGGFAAPQNTLCLTVSSQGGYGIGTDLNRNYGGLWGGPGASGEIPDVNDAGLNSTSYASAIFRGVAPFSEPETQAIRTLISTRQVTTLLTNHTFSNLLLRPVGVVPNTIGPDDLPVGFAPDECFTQADGRDNGMQALGERMSAQVGYSNQFGWELYDTTGTTEDYSYNATGGYGYTFEIGPDEFHPPFVNVINEYVGNTDAAAGVALDAQSAVTSGAGRSCPGETVEAATVGGGLRESYFLALENAADSATHSVLTGTAPAGAEIQVTRSGTFPLWDKTQFEDTVTTTMVAKGGTFEYHTNPSTRPFSSARPYSTGPSVGAAVTEVSSSDHTGTPLPPAVSTEDIEIVVEPGIDAITLTMGSTLPADDYDLELYSPDLVVIGSSGATNTDEYIQFARPNGINPGTYVARVINFAAVGPYQLNISLGTLPDEGEPENLLFSPETPEEWTFTCTLNGETLTTRDVFVARGDSKDLGDVCVTAAAAEEPTPAPEPDPLPATGGGAILAGLMALGTATALRRKG